jgi:carbon monoxide dehydrogenase subunit G
VSEVRAEIELDAAPDEVWDVVMDPHRLEEWVTTHSALGDETPTRLSEGDSFEQELKLSGAKFKVRWTVDECERPRGVTWSGEGPRGSRASVRYTLESRHGGTLFGYENSFELPGGALGKLAGRAVGDRVSRRESERSLENLRSLLEGG